MNVEDKIQIEAEKMLDAYYNFYFKKYPRNKYQLRLKFMPYFKKAASMFCIRDGYDASKLIESFMMDNFKFPQQLCYEGVWKTYLDYLPALHDEKSEEVELVENIVNAAIVIKRFGGVDKWLESKINQQMVIENKMPFDTSLVSFSKCFIDFCEKECGDNYDFELERKYVKSFKSSDKIIEKIKKILGTDYYLFEKELKDSGFTF